LLIEQEDEIMTTYDQIQKQIKELQEQAIAMKSKEVEAIVAEIKAKIAEYGLTATQLGLRASGRRAGKKAHVMYRKGDLTWSGAMRGRRPQWVVEALAAGEDIEKYRVN
jgi:DNA-binding protein H-NS